MSLLPRKSFYAKLLKWELFTPGYFGTKTLELLWVEVVGRAWWAPADGCTPMTWGSGPRYEVSISKVAERTWIGEHAWVSCRSHAGFLRTICQQKNPQRRRRTRPGAGERVTAWLLPPPRGSSPTSANPPAMKGFSTGAGERTAAKAEGATADVEEDSGSGGPALTNPQGRSGWDEEQGPFPPPPLHPWAHPSGVPQPPRAPPAPGSPLQRGRASVGRLGAGRQPSFPHPAAPTGVWGQSRAGGSGELLPSPSVPHLWCPLPPPSTSVGARPAALALPSAKLLIPRGRRGITAAD
ncbi:uncharacterized protein LOC142364443 [Opisthocomus hoazin]|uniref:uncharacterized protein LOC142364443 n=1 Tax=Opisthocomus hoazin TaxID=30419 RepID=UPI003F539B35